MSDESVSQTTAPGCVRLSLQGSPMEVGLAQGRAVKATLRDNLKQYIGGFTRAGVLDVTKMRRDCMPWFDTVAPRYPDEIY